MPVQKPAQKSVGDLWPATIGKVKIIAPVTILKEQAALLGQKTQNIVTAEVVQSTAEKSRLTFSFNLVAPALSNYRARVLQLTHETAQIYPLTMRAGVWGTDEKGAIQQRTINNEEEFLAALKEIFNSPKVSSTIEALRAQSEGFEPGEEIPF